jgi:AraC family transcriptional regulator of arabinose operon
MVRLNAGSRIRHLDFANNALEETLLWLDSVNPRLASSQTDPRVRQAMDCLSTHLAEPFSEARISRAAGLSASRLRHLFLRETGLSPRRFLEIQRLRRAEELLVFTRQTITEIAHELGFENPFYFTLRFKKYRGESPRSFRQRSLGSGER